MSKKIESIDLKERFYIFDNFLKSNEHILERGDDDWDSSKIFFQLAIEHADKSPLTYEAEKFEEGGKVDFDYIRDVNRDEEIYISPLVAILDGHKKGIHKVKTSKGIIYSISKDNDIKLWDTKSYTLLNTLSSHTDSVSDITFMKNGDLVSSSYDKTLKIWDEDTFKNKATLKGHRSFINGIKILNNGNILSYDDDNIRVWDKNNYNCIVSLNSSSYDSSNIKFEENGYVLSYAEDNTLEVIDEKSNKLITSLSHKEYTILDTDTQNNDTIIFSDTLVLNILDDVVYVINRKIQKQIATIKGHAGKINGLKILTNNNVLTYSSDGSLRIWDINKIKYANYQITKKKNSVTVNKTIETKTIVLANKNILSYKDNEINIYDKEHKKLLVQIEGHEDEIDGVIMIDDSRFLSHSEDEVLKIWDADSYECIKTFEDAGYSIDYIKVLEDKSIVLFIDNEVKIWNYNFQLVSEFEIDDDNEVVDIKLLSDGNLLSYSGYKELFILNKSNGKLIHTLEHDEDIDGIEILQNNNILSYSNDNVFKVWDINSYKAIILNKNNIQQYYNLLPSIDKRVDYREYIFENYFNNYYLSIIDKKTNQKLQWHSNYKPKVNALLGEAVTINDGDNGRILKVIKSKVT